jgi:hypothetical protein
MLNILYAIALENGRDKSDEMHGIRLGNFKEFVMVWAFNTNPQYDSTVKFLTSSAVSTLKKEGGSEACSRHSLSAFCRSQRVFKIGKYLNRAVKDFGFKDLALTVFIKSFLCIR